jgi:FkbM family methyltransferase
MHAHVYDLKDLRDSGLLRDAVVLDCGANVGFFTRWALLQGVKQVICLEPSPGNVECLQRKLEVEAARNQVRIVAKGVWDRGGTLSFAASNQRNPGSHHISVEGKGTTTIPVATIDDLVRELGLTRLDYIKMDIEGAELRAIHGAQQTLRRMRPQLCVVTEHTDDLYHNAVAVIDLMREILPDFHYRATEAHPYTSPSFGVVLTPYSLLFYC